MIDRSGRDESKERARHSTSTATIIHALVERDVLEYNAPLTRYWPEFGFAIAIAKNRMTQAWPAAVEATVRQALGLPTAPSHGAPTA